MKHSIQLMTVTIALMFSYTTASAQKAADKILGTYSVVSDATKEKVKVKVFQKGDTYQAQIVWTEKPVDDKGQPRRDILNPDPALRSRTSDQIILVWDMKYNNKDNEWSGGKIYDPDTGKIYKAVFKFENPTNLKVRGYIGMPTFGRTMNWKKIE